MIKRNVIIGIVAITMISGGLLGCSNQNPNKTTNDTNKSISNSSETNKTGQTPSTSNPTDNKAGSGAKQTPNSNISTNKNTAEETYYGQWQINKQLASAPASTYSSDDIKTLIGKKSTFSKESATCFGDKISDLNNTAVNPTYKKSVISKNDFETNNRVTFDKLGIKGDTITKVDVTDTKGNGCTFFIKDNNTLILFGGGEYFELSKI